MSKKHKGRSIPEKLIQEWLEEFFSKKGYSVKREVITPVGKIDLIIYNSSERVINGVRRHEKILIETKEVNSIKHAIGQLESYEKYQSDCSELWCIYFDRYGKRKNIDSSYHNHRSGSGKKIKFNDVFEIVTLEELYKYGEERGIWLLDERESIQTLNECSVTMIPQYGIENGVEMEVMESMKLYF